MHELYSLVLSVSAVLIGVEVISHLFPEKSGALVHALAVLMIAATLLGGILRMDFSFVFDGAELSLETETEDTSPLYVETGTALLRERLYALLDAAGISVAEGAGGVEVWYNQDDSGAVEIDRIRVCVEYATDIARADALLKNVLTDAIRTEVFTP